MTQNERVLQMLRSAGRSGVHSHDFYAEHLPRFAARVRDLKDRGADISSTPERRNGKPGARYRLLKEPIGGEVGVPNAPSAPGPQASPETPVTPSEAADSSGLFDADDFKPPRRHDQVEAA